jgi:Domain of unknown function (DUF4412)
MLLPSLTLPLATVALVAATGFPAPPATPAPSVAPVTADASAGARRAIAAVDGWRFRWKVTSEGGAREASAQPSMVVSLIPGKARMDVEGEQRGGMVKKGGYMILDAAKGTMTIVDPQEKKAMVMEPQALGGMMNAMGGMMKMELSDVKVATESMGAGEAILGYATRKYTVTRSYTLTVTVMGRKNVSTDQSESELWVADRFIDDRAFEEWAKNFGRGFGGMGGEAFKALMEAEQANAPKGTVLKAVTRTTSTSGGGKATTATTTMEMQELKKLSLDASLFEVPSGYEVVDLKAQLAEAESEMAKARAECEREHGKGSEQCDPSKFSVNMDSAMKAGAKEGAKDGAKGAMKRGLRGLIKKP